MKIGEVAKSAGVRTSAIRYYERIGLLPSPQRTGGRRKYTDDVLLRLGVIRFAQECGFTLGEIRVLFAGRRYSARLQQLARDKVTELEGVIGRARGMQSLLKGALRCKCLTLEECGRLLRLAERRSK